MNGGRDADAIVIGSGIGGLTAAAILGRMFGRRVLVFERHWRAGGFTHTFQRPGGYSWDVGLHYVGGLSGSDVFTRVFGYLSDGGLSWSAMPDPFERFVYPDGEFAVPAGREALRAALHAEFPAERRGIDRYLRDRKRASRRLGLLTMLGAGNPVARWLARPALATTEASLARRLRDPRLRSVLVSRWGSYGLPPNESAFGIEGVIGEHYIDGGYYPVGGAGAIARAILPGIEAAGGEVHLRHEVREILVEGGHAVGVRVRDARGEERVHRAPVVLSDAGARTTYLRLLAPEHRGRVGDDVARLPLVLSAVVLYLGLAESPARLGLRGENLWIYRRHGHDYDDAAYDRMLAGEPLGCYASFATMNDPLERAHTAQIISFVRPGAFDRWAGRPWRRRGAEYEELKERIADGFVDMVDEHRPGFRDLVAYREVSTPLSVEGFTGQPGGQVYGLPATPERFLVRGLGIRTPVRGLFLTGADAGLFGVGGATMMGVLAAGKAVGGLAVPRIFKRIWTQA